MDNGAGLVILIIIGLLPLILWVWVLIDILKSRFETEITKVVWLLVVLLLPVLGLILYLLLGRKQKIA
jgi:low temperature requirement protein LtrA